VLCTSTVSQGCREAGTSFPLSKKRGKFCVCMKNFFLAQSSSIRNEPRPYYEFYPGHWVHVHFISLARKAHKVHRLKKETIAFGPSSLILRALVVGCSSRHHAVAHASPSGDCLAGLRCNSVSQYNEFWPHPLHLAILTVTPVGQVMESFFARFIYPEHLILYSFHSFFHFLLSLLICKLHLTICLI
jgi:hypothetical protein